MLDEHTSRKISQTIGLLGSPYAGERDGAALAIGRLLKAAGADWNDLSGVIYARPPKTTQPVQRRPSWARMRDYAWSRRHLLTPKDRQFIQSMFLWRDQPTAAQLDWITDIYLKAERARQ